MGSQVSYLLGPNNTIIFIP